MTQIVDEQELLPQKNPDSSSETLTLEPPPHPDMTNPESTAASFPVRSPRSRSLTYSRKKHHKKSGRTKKASQKKLDTLRQTLNPIPFAPAKTLDFDAHHDLLKRLGLWDFVHIQFDRSFRTDLLAQLIGNFNPTRRCSHVNDVRVMVNRADLGRALKLPVPAKNKKSAAAVEEEMPAASEEEIAFLEELVSNWVLLHEDTWMMSSEVLNYTDAIKEGQFSKVDWAGLIWVMVNEELVKAPKLENCYYAAHLQYLMKCQKEDLFSVKQEEKVEIDLKDDDDDEEEEEYEDGDVKIDDVHGEGALEEQDVTLCLGQEENAEKVDAEQQIVDNVDVEKEDIGNVDVNEVNAGKIDGEEENAKKFDGEQESVEQENVEKVDDMDQENIDKVDLGGEEGMENVNVGQEDGEKVSGEMERVDVEDVRDFEEYKEAEPAQWLLAGKNNLGEPPLQRCNLNGVKDFGYGDQSNKVMELGDRVGEEEDEGEDEEEDQEDEDDQEGGFHLLHKGFSLEEFPSGGLTHALEGMQIPFSSGMPLRDHFAMDFPMHPGSSSVYGHGHKREISHENDNSNDGLPGNKRLRTDGSWNGKMSGDFDMGMDQLQQWMGKMPDMLQWMSKARMMYAAKENECQEASMNRQLLMEELQKRDDFIEHLHKARAEDHQKRQTERFKYEHEIHLMKNLLDGYRGALKSMQKSFAEYRAQHPQAVEPLYRDVPGTGGLVLPTTELEKLRRNQEEEERMKRLTVETTIKDFEAGWISKLEAHQHSIELVSNKLLDVEKELKVIKGGLAKRRLSQTSESAPNE